VISINFPHFVRCQCGSRPFDGSSILTEEGMERTTTGRSLFIHKTQKADQCPSFRSKYFATIFKHSVVSGNSK